MFGLWRLNIWKANVQQRHNILEMYKTALMRRAESTVSSDERDTHAKNRSLSFIRPRKLIVPLSSSGLMLDAIVPVCC